MACGNKKNPGLNRDFPYVRQLLTTGRTGGYATFNFSIFALLNFSFA